MLPTPKYNLNEFKDVYEPSEDTFLLIDALEVDIDFINILKPTYVVEVGCGSGVVVTFLTSALKNKCFSYATDINPLACLATKQTAVLNNKSIECLNMNLLNNFRNNLIFDVIIFNPPYVVTETSEIIPGINRTWAGGHNGREVIDIFLQQFPKLLSDRGVCYMVVIKENKPNEIQQTMNKFGFNCIIIKERKILGEHLFILRFSRV